VEFVIKMESLISLSHDFVVPQNAPATAVVEDVVRVAAQHDYVRAAETSASSWLYIVI